MRLSVLRSTSLTAWSGFLLVVLLAGRGCDTLPLAQDPRTSDVAQELGSLEKAVDTAQEVREAHLSLGLVGVLDRRPSGGAVDHEKPKRSWGAPSPRAPMEHPSHDDPYTIYDDTHWGDFLPVSSSSSSSEPETGFLGKYDPLGGGTFVGEVLDPSIAHNVYAGLPSGIESSSAGSKWTAVQPPEGRDSQNVRQPSENDVLKPDLELMASNTDQNLLKPQPEAEGRLIQEERNETDTQNDLDHDPRNHQEDSPVSNTLSAVLFANGGAGSTHGCGTGKSFPEVSPSATGKLSQGPNEIRAESAAEGGAISDMVSVEKIAGALRPWTSEDRIPNGITEDDVIDDFLDWLFVFTDRIVDRKERNSQYKKRCSCLN